MKPGNLLPGGLQGTPAQDALQKEDSQEKARAAEAAHKSYTPPIPSSTALNGPLPTEVGMGAPVAPDVTMAKPMPPAPAIVTPAPPTFTPPDRTVLDRPAVENEIGGARVTKIAAGDAEGDETSEEGKSARDMRQRAIGDLVNSWSSRPPQTTVVIEPASVKQGVDDPPASGNRVGGKAGDSGVTNERVLVPAGRGIYAHTVLAVDSDTNGPIVLEADTGPISGDRMIGTLSKSGIDRLIVKVETVEHRGKALDANGVVIALKVRIGQFSGLGGALVFHGSHAERRPREHKTVRRIFDCRVGRTPVRPNTSFQRSISSKHETARTRASGTRRDASPA
jgi:intracellular multiplication protein IcmE